MSDFAIPPRGPLPPDPIYLPPAPPEPPAPPTPSRLDEFKARLQELCDEFDAEIDGCGCCGSPWLTVGADGEDCFGTKPTYRL